MLGWFEAALTVGVKILGLLVSKKDQGQALTLADAFPFAISQLLPAVENAIKYQGLDTKEKLDGWLVTFDMATGEEPTAIDIIHGLPADKEEILFDHAIEIARIYGYYKIGVPGFRG